MTTTHIESYAAHLALMRQRPRTVYQRTRSLIRLEAFSGPLFTLDIHQLRAFVTAQIDGLSFRCGFPQTSVLTRKRGGSRRVRNLRDPPHPIDVIQG